MNDDIGTQRVWTKVIGSAALGAAAMFVFDPDKGRRRRALARDKTNWLVRRTGELADAAARDVSCRIEGVRAEAVRRLRRSEPASDDVLRERVRAKLGRVVSHPHALRVDVREGRTTVAGPILASEVPMLMKAVGAVPGVGDVEDRLEPHAAAEHVPALQGARQRANRSAMSRNWTPTARFGATIGGGFLAAYGLGRGGLRGLLALAAGACLVARGVGNAPLDELVDSARERYAGAEPRSDAATAGNRELPIEQPTTSAPMQGPNDTPTMAGTPAA